MSVDAFKERHGYEVGDMWVPRVTSIVSLAYKGAPMRFLQGAISWGIQVHETIQALLSGEDVAVDQRIAPSIRAFEAWRKTHNLVVRDPEQSVERRVVDREHLYAGTIDIIGELDGRVGVIDIKTSIELRDQYALQTAAYLYAFNAGADRSLFPELSRGVAEARWIVRVDQYAECRGCLAQLREKSGRPTVRGGEQRCNHQWGEQQGVVECVELRDHEEDFAAFLSAKELWEWSHRDLLRRITNYPRNLIPV